MHGQELGRNQGACASADARKGLNMKKTTIITGGSRGIGQAITRQLGMDGFNVVIMARGAQEKYRGALDSLSAESIEWLYVQGDIASPADSTLRGYCDGKIRSRRCACQQRGRRAGGQNGHSRNDRRKL
jgi:hypothetical protein